jgi:hypothetical protein
MNVALMLELYRRAAVPFVAENVKLFNGMGTDDRLELLFYMIMDFASNKEKQDVPEQPLPRARA